MPKVGVPTIWCVECIKLLSSLAEIIQSCWMWLCNTLNIRQLTSAVDLSLFVTDSGGVELLIAWGAVETGLVPRLGREEGEGGGRREVGGGRREVGEWKEEEDSGRRREGVISYNDMATTLKWRCDYCTNCKGSTHTSGCDNLLGHVYSSLAARTTVWTLIVPYSPSYRTWRRLERDCARSGRQALNSYEQNTPNYSFSLIQEGLVNLNTSYWQVAVQTIDWC